MRSVFDPDNLWYSEETRVYMSRGTIAFRVFMLILAFGFSIYLLCVKQYLSAIIVFAMSCYFIKEVRVLIAEWEIVQMRINSRGIQIKNEPITPWNKIENERIVTVELNKNYDRSYEYHFAFYDVNKHTTMQFNAHELSLSAKELLTCAKIHRGRFNKNNNPS